MSLESALEEYPKEIVFKSGLACVMRPLEAEAVQRVIAANEARIAGQGRILIRKSGTEPLIRVMAECEDEALLAAVVDEIVGAVLALA